MASHDEFDRFKWEILWDSAFEAFQGIWEPLWSLNGDGSIPGSSQSEREELAERMLRELFDEGLIYFFCVTNEDVSGSADDPRCRLSREEVETVLASDGWCNVPLGEGITEIWFAATKKGEARAADLSDRLKEPLGTSRRFSRLRERIVTRGPHDTLVSPPG